MSPPRLIEMSDLASVLLSPRFGVAQGAFSSETFGPRSTCCSFSVLTGVKSDGSLKVRPVDDMSVSGVNEATEVLEKSTYDSLDLLFHTLRILADAKEVCFGFDYIMLCVFAIHIMLRANWP